MPLTALWATELPDSLIWRKRLLVLRFRQVSTCRPARCQADACASEKQTFTHLLIYSLHHLKRYYLVFILACVGFPAYAQMRQVITYYDQTKKQIKEKYFISSTKPAYIQGIYESFYSNGRPKAKGSYQQGTPEGTWTYFYETSDVKMTGVFHQNKKNGTWKYYFENGNLEMAGNWKLDSRTGSWSFYYENGGLKSQGLFTDGQKAGLWTYFYEDGKKKADVTFTQNQGWYREYNPVGSLQMEGILRNGKSDSTWLYYHDNGKLKAKGIEKDGIREGYWQFFDENGVLIQEGTYQNGLATGQWRYYHASGKIAAEGQKTAGKEEGPWNLFYPTGARRGLIDYTRQEGNYEEYYENGKLKAKGTIRNGLYEGHWEYFYEDDGTQEGTCDFTTGKGLYQGFYKEGTQRMEGQLENDSRVGRWTLYKPDGTIAGYYEAIYGESFPTVLQDNHTIATDTLVKAETQPYQKPPLRLPKKKNWHFVAKSGEYRALIVGVNPIGFLWKKQPDIPISIEYYMQERLGYELTASIYRQPFFTSIANVGLNTAFMRGFSLALRQKFYQPDGELGMFYVAHEVRITGLSHQANVVENMSQLIISARETRYAYSFLIGNRWMRNPGRARYTGKNRLTIDTYAGIGIGFRDYHPQWSPRSDWDAIFKDIPKNQLLIPFRLGFSLGYAF